MRVGLLVPCLVDALYPGVGVATAGLLSRLGVQVEVPPAQTCCGQVFVNSGYPEQALELVRVTTAAFAGLDAVIAPSGSCVGSIRHQYADLARRSGDTGLIDAVLDLSARTFELSEFLVDILGTVDVGARFAARVAYHPTCHSLRLLRVGERPRLLLQNVRDLDLVQLPDAETCCGFGGTFAMKNSDTSAAMLSDKLDAVVASECTVLCASDSSCLMHIGGGLARRHPATRTLHLAEILAAT